MDKIQNYFLIGPMGVGKTTIGRLLAGLLGVSFYDSDREIEASTGADISWIFDVEGEEGFRLRETKMIDILSSKKGIVLATGGGAVLSAQNRANLKNRGQVIYLKATVSQQFARTGRDRNRPLLNTENPLQKINELMKLREPLYREIADFVIDTTRRSPRSVSQEIVRQLVDGI